MVKSVTTSGGSVSLPTPYREHLEVYPKVAMADDMALLSDKSEDDGVFVGFLGIVAKKPEESENDISLKSDIAPLSSYTRNCVCENEFDCQCSIVRERSPINSNPPRNSNGYGSLSPSPEPPDEVAIRCACHDNKIVDNTSRKARIKLVVACIIALIFVVGEVAG